MSDENKISTLYKLDSPLEPSNKFIGNAFEYIEAFDASRKLIDKTKRILQLLQQETQPYQDLDMPLIGVSTPEDDEILIGWSVSHVRIGFSIEGGGDESSWYAVTDGTIDATNAWGYLNDYESEEKLVAFLVSYIVGT
ncbi:MAG: hypothetical protein SFZ02_05705 [bacterium]|nr:hypothetical protein [bacterium]